jgi:hypothetical protein
LISIESIKESNIEFKFDKFINREEGIKSTLKAANKNLESFNKNISTNTKTQDHCFIQVNGGSGAGKTRASNEIKNILKENGKDEIFQNTQQIYIDFSNGDKILDFEDDTLQILGLRIFIKAATNGSLDDFVGKYKSKIKYYIEEGVFMPSLVFEVIGKLYHNILKLDSIIPIVIILDNYQFTIDKFPENKKWKDIASSIGKYMCNSTDKNINTAADKLLIIPVIAGTIPNETIYFDLTLYGNISFPLPPFTFENIMTIIKEEFKNEEFYNTYEKNRFWYLIGMIPRSLEYILDLIKKESIDFSTKDFNLESLYKKINLYLNDIYSKNIQFNKQRKNIILCFNWRRCKF